MTSRTATVLVSLAIAAAVLSPAASGSATKKRKPFSGRICELVRPAQLAAAHLAAPCVPSAPRTIAGGAVRALVYSAHWGDNPLVGNWLSVNIQRLGGSAKEAAQAQRAFRKSVVSNGAPVPVGSLGTVHGREGLLLFIRHDYNAVIILDDRDPSASGASIKTALISIGKSIAAKL